VRIFAVDLVEAGQEFSSRSHSEAPVLRVLGGVWGESLQGIILSVSRRHNSEVDNSLGYSLC
jgi:hypothetical protein